MLSGNLHDLYILVHHNSIYPILYGFRTELYATFVATAAVQQVYGSKCAESITLSHDGWFWHKTNEAIFRRL